MAEDPNYAIIPWTLTPANIPEFCEKSGADVNKIMAAYRQAKSQGKPLYGFIRPEWEK